MRRALLPLALLVPLPFLTVLAAPTQEPPGPGQGTGDPENSGGDSAPTAVEAYRDAVESILDRGLVEGQAYALLTELCTTAPHRLAGTPGADTAVAWARATMEEIGLENVRLEPCTVPRWSRGTTERLEVLEPEELRGMELPIAALGGSVATPPAGVAAPLVQVRSFGELEELGEAARGKIVFFSRPMDHGHRDMFAAYGQAVEQRVHGASRAARVGGVAALVRSIASSVDDFPHTGAMRYDGRVPEKVPTAAVSTRGAELLSAALDAGQEVVVRLTLDCATLEDGTGANVVGELVGHSSPEEIVLVGGHLDCWDIGMGAHDDGSGCCHALEAVRLLKELGLTPRRTIRVVLFANEENGLRGAHAYHDAHLDELDRHVLALESDRGGFAPRGFTSDARPRGLAILRAIAELLDEAGAGRVIRGSGGADIGPLAREGVPVVGFLPTSHRYFDYHHSDNDRLENVNPRELQLGACVIASMIYVVADLEEPFPRD